MHFILTSHEGMEFVVRPDSQGAFGVAFGADEDVV